MSDLLEARERAAAFVGDSGDPFWRAAVDVLQGGTTEPARALLVERQRPDGSFAEEPDAALRETRRVLGLLADLRLLGAEPVPRACGWIEAAQTAEGCWGDRLAADEALFETGMLVGQLARSRCARAAMLDAAGDWLAAGFSPDRVQGFVWRPVAAYASAFANLPHEAGDAVLQWCGRELERGYRAGRFGAVCTARVLLSCDASVLPGARLDPAELVAAVAREQADDGGWLEPGSPPGRRLARSWDGLLALHRLAPGA